MPEEQVVHVDPFRPLGEEPGTGHNRWHEAIEPGGGGGSGRYRYLRDTRCLRLPVELGIDGGGRRGGKPEPGAPVDRARIREGGGVRRPLRGGDCRDRGRPLGAVGLYHSGTGLRLSARRVSRPVYRPLATTRYRVRRV